MNSFTSNLLVFVAATSIFASSVSHTPTLRQQKSLTGANTTSPPPVKPPAPITKVPISNLPIVITADQPNIWTLEQAHYLLAQMHRRNLDLKAASVGELDANAINGVNVDALKTVLAASAEFDQSIGVNNRMLKDEKAFNTSRKRQLIERRANLEDQSLALTKQIAEVKIKQVHTKDEQEKKDLQAEIDELTVVQAMVKEQITQTNDQLTALPATDKDFSSVGATVPEASASGTYESVFKDTAKAVIDQFNNGPKLNASLRLDNYLQMEYEILSKQLTLLRDEVGPGERLIFMEIPQSVNVSYGQSNQKWAQSWWRVAAYSRCVLYDDFRQTRVPCNRILNGRNPQSAKNEMATWEVASMVRNSVGVPDPAENELTVNDIESKWAIESYFSYESPLRDRLFPYLKSTSRDIIKAYNPEKNNSMVPGTAEWRALRDDMLRVLNSFIRNQILQDFSPEESTWARANSMANQTELSTNSSIFRRLFLEEEFGWIKPKKQSLQHVEELNPTASGNTPAVGNQFTSDAENRSVRVVDLFPRQSSLNVNDLKLTNNTFSAKFLFNLLSGWGGGASYERERERYSQFVQQELYASAFGKGGREFGWTFNPMPGTDRLLSGVRTTYAILIVPDDASSIVLESRGCFFPRSASQPSNFDDGSINDRLTPNRGYCSGARKFIVPIPDGGKSNVHFGVTALNYRNVNKGERSVVTIIGENLSSQVGVLVNGIPLTQSLGLGQPFIRDDSGVGRETKTEVSAAKVKGTFERIDQTQIVATIEMDKDYEGTPTITLVAPGTAWELNSQEGLIVNGTAYPTKYVGYNPSGQRDFSEEWPSMFGPKAAVTLDKVSAFATSDNLRLVLTGKNLSKVLAVFVNGLQRRNPMKSGYPVSAAVSMKQASAIFEDHLIALSDLPKFPKDKTLTIALLTKDGAINASPIDNPALENEPEAPIKYVFDESKLTITAKPSFESCEENGETLTAVFVIEGKGFTEKTHAFTIDKDKKEQEQEFFFESSTKGTLKLKNPAGPTKLLFKDSGLKVMTQKVLIWKKPKEGC